MAEKKEMAELETLVAKLDGVADDDEATIEQAFYATAGITSEDVPDELSEADLENVSGGITELGVLKWLIQNTRCGQLGWTGAKVCARCLYDYYKYGNAYKTYSKSYVSKLNKDFEKSIPKWIKALG